MGYDEGAERRDGSAGAFGGMCGKFEGPLDAVTNAGVGSDLDTKIGH